MTKYNINRNRYFYMFVEKSLPALSVAIDSSMIYRRRSRATEPFKSTVWSPNGAFVGYSDAAEKKMMFL